MNQSRGVSRPSHKPPYIRLSSFYLTYFATLGAFAPFWTLYLQHLGYSVIEIGELMAISMLTKLFGPWVWGWLADHYGKRLLIIQLASMLSIVSFAGVFIDGEFLWMALVMTAFGFFWNAALPQYEAVTMNYLGKETRDYSRIRLWGSVGFIVMVAGLPLFLEAENIDFLPYILLGLFTSIWFSSLLIKDKQADNHPHHEHLHLGQILRKPIVIALLLACVLQQGSHGVYYTFFSIYLEDHGYSRIFVGQMWALGVLAEVILFIFMPFLLRHYDVYSLFIVSLVVTAVRWVLLAYFVDSLPILFFAQILHAASYGLFHAAAIDLVHTYFPGKLQGRGQALYASLSFGVGGALGSYFGGYTWEYMGASLSFMLMMLASFLGVLIALWGMWQDKAQAS